MIIDLAKIYRGNNVESLHYGIACLVDDNNLLANWGDSSFSCFTRSSIKPIQAKAVLSSGVNLTDEVLAISMASHKASEEQLNSVNSLLSKYGFSESDLKCGKKSESRGLLKSELAHNCSGKHAAILAACKVNNWNSETYYKDDHEYNQALLREINNLIPDLKIDMAKDGCGLATFYMQLKEMALLFSRIARDDSYSPLISCMNKYPDLIGGEKQIDSILMKTYPNKFMAKVGAEGLVIVANLELGQALALKIIDGTYRARSQALISLLEHLKWIEKDSIQIDSNLYNSLGDIVGRIEANSNW